MQLSIKNDEAHKLATELAGLTGESLNTAVTLALRERLARERRRSASRPDRGTIDEDRKQVCSTARCRPQSG